MNSLTKKRVVPTHFGRLYSDGAYGDAGNWVRRAEVDALLDEIERLTTALDAAKKVIADLRDEDGRLREELRGIMLAAHDNPTRMRQMACEALGQPAEPKEVPGTDYARGNVNPNVTWVRFPDPPYQFRGDSGKIECPLCNGDGSVYPPESRTGDA